MEINMFTDGGSRGNPGPAAIGVVIKSLKGETLRKIGMYMGHGTNNDAEYKALNEGLKEAIIMKAKVVNCYLDSELVVKQMTGLYKVKNENIKKHWDQVKKLELSIGNVKYHHVMREKNKEADELVNRVLDSANKNEIRE
jgi:ribonuclease HI